MINFLIRKFIKDYENYEKPEVRGRYGILCSIVSIILNVLMAAFKIALGFITNSVALLADGFNNLSDVASNVATMLGFVFSVKTPDKEHPFGHGRLEYLAGLFISVLILFVGLQTLWDSINNVIFSEAVYFSYMAVIGLIISIIIKYLLGKFNLLIGAKIKSDTLIAAGRDSKIDILATVFTLIALFASLYTELPVDGVLGSAVSVIILKTGYEIAKETITSLLGPPPDENLLEELKIFTNSYDRVLGMHDLMIHDYGHGRRYLTMHVEVNKNEDMMMIHDVIDNIERDIYHEFKIKATIHLDPIDLDDDLTHELKKLVAIIVTAINPTYSIHDFRFRQCEKKSLLIFDVLIPADDTISHIELQQRIDQLVKAHNPFYNTLIVIDHSYT